MIGGAKKKNNAEDQGKIWSVHVVGPAFIASLADIRCLSRFQLLADSKLQVTTMASKAGIDRRDDDGKCALVSEFGIIANMSFDRGLPRLQVLAVSEPEHAIPDQPGVLPQDVRVLRRPNLLVWSS